MKLRKGILVVAVALVCLFAPSSAFGVDDPYYGWNTQNQYPDNYTPAYWIRQISNTLDNVKTALSGLKSNLESYNYGWTKPEQYPSNYTPLYWLKDASNTLSTVKTTVNNLKSNMETYSYGWNKANESPVQYSPAYWLKSIYDKLGTISSGGSSSGGTGSNVEDWATLFGWMTSINGELQLIYGEVQNVYDKLDDIYAGGKDYTSDISSIGSKLETGNGAVTSAIDKLYNLANSNQFGWNVASSEIIIGSPYDYIKKLHSVCQGIQTEVNLFRAIASQTVFGWNTAISDTVSNSPIWYLKQIQTNLNAIASSLENFRSNASSTLYGMNSEPSSITSNSPIWYLRQIYRNMGGTDSGDSTDYTQVLDDIKLLIGNGFQAVDDDISGIREDLATIVRILLTPDVSEVVGDFDYDQLADNAGDIVDKLATLAPFGAGALISSMLAIWSGASGGIVNPSFDVPFEFVAGANSVVIDVSWLNDVKPVIDFMMITLLLFCLVNASMRVIEMEASR